MRRQKRIEDAGQRLRPENHPGASAVGPVVRPLARLERLAQIVEGDRHDAALVGASQDRKPDCRGEELGEERDDVDA